jgi:hypothetical protein
VAGKPAQRKNEVDQPDHGLDLGRRAQLALGQLGRAGDLSSGGALDGNAGAVILASTVDLERPSWRS